MRSGRRADERVRLTPLADDLRSLVERAGDRPTTLEQLVGVLQERGTAVLIILLAAPFVLPLPLPGLSMPFGVAICILGVRLGFGRAPWLPAFLARRELRPSTLAAIVRSVERVSRPIERLLRPRWAVLSTPPLRAAGGIAIAVGALLLLPPLPLPGINALPSLAIVLLALGFMERDGLAIAAGGLVLAASYAYLLVWWDVAMRVFGHVAAGV